MAMNLQSSVDLSSEEQSEENEANNRLYHEAQDRLAHLGNYYEWILKHFRTHLKGTVVELGVGAGYIIDRYLDQVEKVVAVDYNDDLLRRIESRLPASKVTVANVDLRQDWVELRDVQADAVMALDVVEHFDDHLRFCQNAFATLKPGGVFLVKVPAQSSLFGEADKASGHYRRYDKSDLDTVLTESGFEIVKLDYMNVFGSLIYRLKRKNSTNFSKNFSRPKLALANAMMKILSLFDALLPFGVKGLSLVAIARKPGEVGD